MRNINLLLIVVILVSMSVNAQKKNADVKKLPTSIYTFTKDLNSILSIHKNIDLKKLNSDFADAVNLEMNQYSLNVKNINKISSKFIYDDLRRYQDRKRIKDFILEHDPISWNLHYNQLQALPPKG